MLFTKIFILLWNYSPFTLVADSTSLNIFFTGSNLLVGELMLTGSHVLLAWPHVFTRPHIVSTRPYVPFSAGPHLLACPHRSISAGAHFEATMYVFAGVYVLLFPGRTLDFFFEFWTLMYLLLCNLKLSSRCLRCSRWFCTSSCFWFCMLLFMFADGSA